MFTHPDFEYRAAGVIVWNHHILLCRSETEHYWYLPGATMRLYDQAIVTLERELQRQTGLKPFAGRLIWAVNGYYRSSGKTQHEVGLYHLVEFERNAPIYCLDKPYRAANATPGKPLLTFQWFPCKAELLERLPLQPKFLARAVEKLPLATEYIVIRDSAVVAV